SFQFGKYYQDSRYSSYFYPDYTAISEVFERISTLTIKYIPLYKYSFYPFLSALIWPIDQQKFRNLIPNELTFAFEDNITSIYNTFDDDILYIGPGQSYNVSNNVSVMAYTSAYNSSITFNIDNPNDHSIINVSRSANFNG